MKSLKLLCIAAMVAVSGSRIQAQTAASPAAHPAPPSGPLLKPAEDFAAWTIVRQSIPGLAKLPSEEVAKAVATATKPDNFTSVTKTGAVRHQTTTQKTREHEEIWYERGNRILMESIWKEPMFQRSVSPPNQPAGPDFPEFAWISPQNFVGTQEAQNSTYLVFESEVALGDVKTAKLYGTKVQTVHDRAFIDADTRLPWVLQTDNVLQRYVFQAAPTEALVVPPEYQAMFDAFEKQRIEASRKPTGP